jgi:hypothetical protein
VPAPIRTSVLDTEIGFIITASALKVYKEAGLVK